MPDDLGTTPLVAPRTGVLRPIIFALLGAALVWIVLTRTLPTSLAETAPDTALFLQPNEPRILLKRARADVEALYVLAETQSQVSATKSPSPPAPSAGAAATFSDRLSEMAQVAERLLPADGRPNEPNVQQPNSSVISPIATGADQPRGLTAPSDKTNPIRDLARRSIAADPFNAGALTILGQLSQLQGDAKRTGPLMAAAAGLSIRESYAVYWLLQQAQEAGDDATVIQKAETLLRTRGRSVASCRPGPSAAC